jgi:uncharacterized protein YdaL
MKKSAYIVLFCFCLFLFLGTATAWAGSNRALILRDEAGIPMDTDYENTLADLLGHFNLPYDIKNVDDYASGDADSYFVTFYLGSVWDKPLPAAFTADVLASNSRIVWVNYNLWQLAWGDSQAEFENRFGFRFVQVRNTGNFTRATYGGRTFYRTQEDFSQVSILDAAKALRLVNVTNGTTNYGYVVKSGNFWFVADNPLAQQNEDSVYLIFADVLHDMLGAQHAETHRAMVRIEDVDATEDPAAITAIADYLYGQGVPFTLAVIPRFADPLGAWGPPMTLDINQSPELQSALAYAVSKGGTIASHGFTHQYSDVANPTNGVSGVDSEFWFVPDNTPVPEDSPTWAQGRVDSALGIFEAAGLGRPAFWVTPHYLASTVDRQVFASNFTAGYERVTNAFYPYPLAHTVYGGRLVPENLGYISPPDVTGQAIVNRSDRYLSLRDGVASFFFHPEEDINQLKTAIAGMKAKGFTFIGPGQLTWESPPDADPPVITAVRPAGDIYSATAAVGADFGDTGSGIDTAAVTVTLDGSPLTGCGVTQAGVSCPATAVALGSHSIGGVVYDIAGNWSTISGGFTVVDNQAPALTYTGPAGFLTTDAATVTATYSDPAPSSGVASAGLSLNGGDPAACQVGGGDISCAVSGLADGHYDAVVSVTDGAGNTATATGGFDVDTTSPAITNLVPSGTVSGRDTTISADLADAGSGIDTAAVTVTLDGNPLACQATSTHVSCNAIGLADGTHAISVSAEDVAGNAAVAGQSFVVSYCPGSKPPLSLNLTSTYWSTYAEYLNHMLSVDFELSNDGGAEAYNVTVAGAHATNGVALISSPEPFPVPAFGAAPLSLKFAVPPGVQNFRTQLSVTALDSCGNLYEYGGPGPAL